MSNIFFIRGTISVQVDGCKSKIWITPCTGFLTPDKKNVIAFPVPSPEDEAVEAKLIKWSDDKQFKFEFEAKNKAEADAIKANIPSLLAVAAQQKPIELRLEESPPTGLKITGFVFPAPSDHAQGR
jgi:hypothetical protein